MVAAPTEMTPWLGSVMTRPHVQVILGDETIPPGLQTALDRAGATASFRPLSEALRSGQSPGGDAVVIVAPDDSPSVSDRLKVLFDRIADRPRATLVLKSSSHSFQHLSHPDTLPVSFAAGLEVEELTTRLKIMLDMRHSLESLHQGMLASHESEQNAARTYRNQLRLASQVQREFLPAKLPRYGPLSFQTVFRPADYVSGDIYDIQRLDEDHVGIALADATGHGIPAALLTVFIKRALRGKEIHNGVYRILQPDEVLSRLNDDILDANLSECRFVAAVYAVVNIRTLVAAVARGGAPFPILRRVDGRMEILRPAGGVVGVLPEATFEVEVVKLAPGDSLVLYTDGLEKLVVPQGSTNALAQAFQRAASVIEAWREVGLSQPLGTAVKERELACATAGADSRAWFTAAPPAASVAVEERPAPRRRVREDTSVPPEELVTRSTWYALLRERGLSAALEQVDHRHEVLQRIDHPLDDLTIVALQVAPG